MARKRAPLAQNQAQRHQLWGGSPPWQGGSRSKGEKEEVFGRMDSRSVHEIGPIESDVHVETLVEEGFEVRGPRGDFSKDLVSFKRILKTGRVFVPEPFLVSQGYQAVEPSPFTQGKRILWKEMDNFPDEYASSNYSLIRGEEEALLYLKVELPDLEG
jgi:hypothetical protein